MNERAHSATAGGICRICAAVLFAATFLAPTTATPAAEARTLKATYVISIASIVVGRVEAQTRISGNSYATTLRGSTSGLSRLVTDATARITGAGRISGNHILPTSFDMDTLESGSKTRVRMAMRGGNIVDLEAAPRLSKAKDRVPVKPFHKMGIVDPLSAFLIPNERRGVPIGARVCNRTVKVFDGWQRFDIRLFYKETKAVDGSSDMYSGRVIVCGAQYIPVAGHRANFDSVKFMAENKRLEVWFVPVEDMRFLVPYRILIGTKIGDLVIYATRFSADPPDRRASIN